MNQENFDKNIEFINESYFCKIFQLYQKAYESKRYLNLPYIYKKTWKYSTMEIKRKSNGLCWRRIVASGKSFSFCDELTYLLINPKFASFV